VDVNEATRELIALSSSNLQRNRVVLRLLNACDAMSDIDDRSRQLTISTAGSDSDQVRVIVRDAGVGLDPGTADKLFEAFYTTKESGMGIGLSVSRSIIEKHQGRIWAAQNDGPGATFSFSIPAFQRTCWSRHR
jgi:signal transduction histidine kinase